MSSTNDRQTPDQTLLIVDDTPDNISLLASILDDTYRVRAARDGESALRIAASSEPPDLILLDVMMPMMNGYEVCRRLKSDPATADIPVIFVTARVGEGDESYGFEVGGVDYISKPISAPTVRARVKTHLELSQARRYLEETNRQLTADARMREEVEAINRHDLKNPLLVVMNAPKVLRGGGTLSEGQNRMLALVEVASARMLEIINHTVNLYKMENGTYVVEPTEVELLEVLRSIEAMVAGMPLGREVRMSVKIDGRAPTSVDRLLVTGEELLVHSILANLVKNAAEAAEEGEVIRVALESGEPVHVSIHNRRAVPLELRSRFFKKFSTSGKRGGTGLGTYAAKLMTEALGGTISLMSEEPAGTTVSVSLPPAQEEAAGN